MLSSLHCPRILAFIIGEVKRQGFDVETSSGAERVINMSEAWDLARQTKNAGLYFPTLADIKQLGMMVEPAKNYNGFRNCFVTVGEYVAPAPEDVVRNLVNLLDGHGPFLNHRYVHTQDADKFYVDFEKIHPFLDGNGRVGKILHNWVLGSLEDPILVIDYFGNGIP